MTHAARLSTTHLIKWELLSGLTSFLLVVVILLLLLMLKLLLLVLMIVGALLLHSLELVEQTVAFGEAAVCVVAVCVFDVAIHTRVMVHKWSIISMLIDSIV